MTESKKNRHSDSRFRRRAKRILLALAALLLVPALTGAFFQYTATAISERRHPPPGKLVEIGGYRLHLNCTGEGQPAVIMDAGAGGNSLSWSLVQPEVAKFTRVCAYDRAGLGWSDRGPLPRTSKQFVKELHALLVNAGIKGPYVLVGHSLGGLNVRLYAATYPDDAAGMVLVDSAHEDQFTLFPKIKEPLEMRVLKTPFFYKSLSVLGVIRLFTLRTRLDPRLPPRIQAAILTLLTRTANLFTITDEYSAIMEDSLQLRAAQKTLGDMPLVVITHAKGPIRTGMSDEQKHRAEEIERIFHDLQAELSRRSHNGRLIVAATSGHNIQIDESALVIDAVRSVVNAARR